MMNTYDKAKGAFSMPPIPWKRGFDDGVAGANLCPYPAMSRDAWAWSSGYVEGSAAVVIAARVMSDFEGARDAKSTH